VALSIVGIDGAETGYDWRKVEQEPILRGSEVPCTILRATQFQEFADQMLDRGIGLGVVVPRILSAPVAATEVAVPLVQLPATRHLGDLAGGDRAGDARRWLAAEQPGTRRQPDFRGVSRRKVKQVGPNVRICPDMRWHNTAQAWTDQ
jgi:hypothetical protein